jgi:FKBP-type peptidyl-prolyl cis-trans isomerase SlyD
MQVADQKIVSIDYTLTNDDGEVLDSSQGREPLHYLHGAGNIIPGLERALTGKSPGDAVQAKIPPTEAYGEKDPQLVQAVPRDRFPAKDVTVGMQFQAQGGGQTRIVTVVAIDPQNVTIDANHPLAGQTLNFDVKVVDVRDATSEELSHGHVHGPGGHQHG